MRLIPLELNLVRYNNIISYLERIFMTSPLVECIPNFSEARRREVIETILESIRSVPNVHILDHHSDVDHNRTVVTYIGSPAEVEEAAFQAIQTAAKLINLDEHEGEHPRLGATDVVPFVPISEITMQECVEMARRLAKRVGSELNLPTFLYEEAATIPEKQNLESIRKGQYEALKEEIGSSPVRTPDFGPYQLGPAGATVIGARQPLIAFNIYLTTNDVSIAQKIGRAVRHSSGGLRYVKAMGVLVEGRAQVSMNLTNFSKTPIARVVEFVRREAERYGVGIHSSELVGLIPQAALIDAALWYAQLDGFENSQILEQRLFEAARTNNGNSETEEPGFLDQLASAAPTPGGGSAAAYASASAAALVAMVARTTTGKKKYADVQDKMWVLIDQAEELRAALTEGVKKDSEAFDGVMAAFKLPKNSEEEIAARSTAIQKATLSATDVPLQSAKNSLSVMELALEAATYGNLNAISDAGAAFNIAKAGLTAAGLNVRINVPGLENQKVQEDFLTQINQLENKGRELEAQLFTILKERGNFQFD
ncbi:MAG: glutamate formimidoyltransferase [Anaerolineaceae bacterium]|nr:glutamate formimidoyltransferase [Anaerolineaceae bacterium]